MQHAVEASATQFPERIAIQGPDDATKITYAELEAESRGVAHLLRNRGLRPGDRVGVWMRKSVRSVSLLLGVLRAGCLYVPLDHQAPRMRLQVLIADGELSLITTDPDLERVVSGVLAGIDVEPFRRLNSPRVLVVDDKFCLAARKVAADCPSSPDPERTGNDIAYILYTSGSTGKPKGVMLTHAHALSFIGWAADEAGVAVGDQVASHAPFHFDLSIFDLWASLSRGATVHLLDPVTARFPAAVAQWICARAITVWYSVPSALVPLLPILDAQDVSKLRHPKVHLRTVAFAGEVFPHSALRALRCALPTAELLNWFGPTETNVCAYYRVPHFVDEIPDPLPIGRLCPNFQSEILEDDQRPVEPGAPGYLWLCGPGVFAGYWNDESRTREVTTDRGVKGGLRKIWYNTGDRVQTAADGYLRFLGRSDDLVKCRGYRISLLEVQNALLACPGVRRAAVLAGPDAGRPEYLHAFVSSGEVGLTVDKLRQACGQFLPGYMVPERFTIRTSLPETSTGKIDRQGLSAEMMNADGQSGPTADTAAG